MMYASKATMLLPSFAFRYSLKPTLAICSQILKPATTVSFQYLGARHLHHYKSCGPSLRHFIAKNSSQCQNSSILSPNYNWKISPSIRAYASGKGTLKEPVTWKSFFITAGIGGFIMLILFYIKQERELKSAQERSKFLGKAALGGPWTLVDHNNQPRSNKDFFGQWVLLYFGFTHCPDICPDEIEKMIQVVDYLDESSQAKSVTPLFITVDAERDSVEAIRNYVKEFSPKLIGLTGDKDKVHEASRAYRVYYSAGPKDEDNDYIVDHTIIMYLLNPNGDFVDYYGQNRNAKEISDSITLHMKKFDLMN